MTQADRAKQGGEVKMERDLAPDQDPGHNVPSSSQPPNKAVQRRAPWQHQTRGPGSHTKKDLKNRERAHVGKALEPMANSQCGAEALCGGMGA